MRLGIRRIGRGLRHVERERQDALELRLHLRLVVGEHEAAVGIALTELRRPRQRVSLGVREVGGLAVRHVQHVGRQARLEVGDGRVVAVARECVVDRVVRSGSAGLPPLGVQQPLAERVPVHLEREVGPVEQRHHRLRLGLGPGRRAAIGVAADLRRRPLFVVPEVLGEVAVGVDAVGPGDHAVVVVVAQVLAPQPLVVERVLVAVGVGDDHEPQLVGLQEVLDLLVVGAPAVDEPVHQPPVDLGGDPLARVLRRAVQHGRPRAIRDAPGALGQLQRDELATLVGLAEHLELDQLRVLLREAVQLVADAARLIPGSEDLVARRGLLGCQLLGRLAVLVLLDLDVDTAVAEALRLVLGEHDVEAHAGLGVPGSRRRRSRRRRCSAASSVLASTVYMSSAPSSLTALAPIGPSIENTRASVATPKTRRLGTGMSSRHHDSFGPSPARKE